ncbi:MAG: prolipoprotein diacylglyceryl transferase [Bacteroidetes bacterium]|nr:prolipoprotein diacylglyceryl transferase [Bacteroidota bacterium]
MYPVLFKIGNTNIYSYGVCLIIAIASGIFLFSYLFTKKKLPAITVPVIIFFALFSFYIGGKLFYLLDELPFTSSVNIKFFFSTSGFNFLGGLLTFFALIFIYSKIAKVSALEIFDLVSFPLLLIYCIGRLGCHLSGDGDYGTIIPPSSPFAFLGTSYEKGTLPTLPGVMVHPTPLYEIVITILIFLYLWRKQEDFIVPGLLFSLYLILTGIERFSIEFIRLNPKIIAGMTQTQLISLIFIFFGIFLYRKTNAQRLKELYG